MASRPLFAVLVSLQMKLLSAAAKYPSRLMRFGVKPPGSQSAAVGHFDRHEGDQLVDDV